MIAEVKKAGVRIPDQVLSDSGKSFILASAKDPGAWKTAEVLINYKSEINQIGFLFPSSGLLPEESHFAIADVPGKDIPHFSMVPVGVPTDRVARFQRIGQPTNVGIKVGPSTLILSGGAVDIEGMDIAHTIFHKVEVHYKGGPLLIEDVMFINCIFIFNNTEQPRLLAASILGSKSVSFSTIFKKLTGLRFPRLDPQPLLPSQASPEGTCEPGKNCSMCTKASRLPNGFPTFC